MLVLFELFSDIIKTFCAWKQNHEFLIFHGLTQKYKMMSHVYLSNS